jgi:oxygen-independent coproporphyrinogen-3 oxidase
MTRLEAMLQGSPYAGYAYSYPHKTAYRPLRPPVPLDSLWAGERRDALFLYLHVPFCEMRCGFCNLFTTTHPSEDLEARYLEALRRQAREVREAVGPATVARLAVGGGTPTYLAPDALHALFDLAREYFGADPARIPTSVETSPATATPARLRVLRERGVDRVSIGVQSFVEAEVAAVGRAQRTAGVERALDCLCSAGFPKLNIDLMYGLPGQSLQSWLASLQAALRFAPEELYLYPLYVRPLTGIDRRAPTQDDLRIACYRAARNRLHEHGYTQLSMRMFQRPCHREAENNKPQPPPRTPNPQSAIQNPQSDGPVYCCQEDGMLGLGCGARSYTRALHYSSEYAVGRAGVREILADYIARPDEAFAAADYGAELDGEEQRRRYVIKSLLRSEGLHLDGYRAWFGTGALDDLPELAELEPLGLARHQDARLCLTDTGLEVSDVIGPWLYSERARRLMESYPLR